MDFRRRISIPVDKAWFTTSRVGFILTLKDQAFSLNLCKNC